MNITGSEKVELINAGFVLNSSDPRISRREIHRESGTGHRWTRGGAQAAAKDSGPRPTTRSNLPERVLESHVEIGRVMLLALLLNPYKLHEIPRY